MKFSSKPFAAASIAIGLSGCVGGCAGTAPQPSPPVPAVPARPVSASLPTSVPVVGAIPAAQAAAAQDRLLADLARRLKPESSAGVVGVARRAGGAPRVLLDAEQSFETGSAQMRAETLLRVAECAAAVQGAGAVVVHVIGSGEPAATADSESLGERRATSVVSYLLSRGLSASRLRAEGRVTKDQAVAQRLELVFEPIIEGREVRAWMPPAVVASK